MGLLDIAAGMLGGGQSANSNPNPQAALINAVIGMLANNGSAQGGLGGLGGLIGQLQKGGLGDIVGSWVGTGQNLPVSADQLQSALGGHVLNDLAQKTGLSQGDLLGHLTQILPQVVDKLTPNGQVPQGGLGNAGQLIGMLGGLLNKG